MFSRSWSFSARNGSETKQRDVNSLQLLMPSHAVIHLFLVSLGAILPLIRSEFGLSYTQIGILAFSLSALSTVGSVPMGFISDRMNQLRLISYMFFVMAALAPLLLLTRNVVLLFLLLGLLRLCMAIFHPAAQTHLSRRYSTKRGAVFGLFEVGGSLGMIIAPSLAVGIAYVWGWESVYAAYALPSLLLAFGILRVTQGRAYLSDNSKSKSAVRFREGLKTILSSRRLRLIFGTQGAYACIFAVTLSYFCIFLVDLHEFTVLRASYLLTLLLCGGVLGRFVGGRTSDRWGRNRIMGLSFALLVPFLLLFSFVQGWPVLAVLSFFFGLILHMILPVITASIGDHATGEVGLTYGMQSLVGSGCGSMCSLLAGILADVFGITVIFLFLTGACFVGLACTYLLAIENRTNSILRSGPFE